MGYSPLVSIIIPTYRREKDIIKAVKSAINQTYKNKEIIVVDDNVIEAGEINKTEEALKEYIESNKIRYIKNDGIRGGSGSRNKGISIANGEFIAFLDDDDEYFPQKIQEQYNYYLKNKHRKIGLVYCYALGVNRNKEVISKYHNDIEGESLYESMIGCIAGTSLWFAPKDVLLEVGGFVDTVSKQDTMTIIKILSKGYEIIRVPKELVYYYEYEGNKISGVGSRAIEGQENVRRYSRKLYHLLNDNEKVRSVEYTFSKKLLTLYLINKNRKKARSEFKNMFKLQPINISTIKAGCKYLLTPLYNAFLKINRYHRFN